MPQPNGLPLTQGHRVLPDKSWVVPVPTIDRKVTEAGQLKQVRYLLWRVPSLMKDTGSDRATVRTTKQNLEEYWAARTTGYDDFIRHVEHLMYLWLCSQSEQVRHIYRGG